MRLSVLSAMLGIALALLLPAAAIAGGPSAQPRVVGGSASTTAQYPWQAAVVLSTAQRPGQNAHQRQFCGGSLITAQIVITAGHCVADNDPDCSSAAACSLNDPSGDGTQKVDPDDVDVVLGRTTLSDASSGEEMPVQAVLEQSNFDPAYGSGDIPRYDVAYLVLASPASEPPIQIAGADERSLWAPDGWEEISGWGSTSETGGTVDTLRSAAVPITDDSTCASEYGSNFDASTMVCAGFQGGGVDTCYGDSGGPLEAPLDGGGYRLVGITSWGAGCAEPDFAGVYTRIAGPTMADLIQSDVSNLETTYGLDSSVSIFGAGGVPRYSMPPAPPPAATSSDPGTPDQSSPPDSSSPPPAAAAAPSTQRADPYAKCKLARTKEKRRRCTQHVRRHLALKG
jgi:secreted trypsin-like serine protease